MHKSNREFGSRIVVVIGKEGQISIIIEIERNREKKMANSKWKDMEMEQGTGITYERERQS